MNTNRRQFLAAAAATTATAVSVPAMAAPAPRKWDKSTDVVVVGGGAAGLCAAYSAREAGCKVTLIEKNSTPMQNTTTYSLGQFCAAGTKAQARQGITDPGAAVFAEEIIKGGHGLNDRHVVEVYAQNAAETLDWLEDTLGLTFKAYSNGFFKTDRMHRNNKGTGGAYTQLLSQECAQKGVNMCFDTKAVELITNQKADTVIGIRVQDEDRTYTIRAKKAVILCTGGFSANGRLIDTYLPEFKGSFACAAPASAGEGLMMAQKIGAGTFLINQCAIYCYGVPVDRENRRGNIFLAHAMAKFGSIAVDRNGKRFVAEETGPTGAAIAASRKRILDTYVILTEAQLNEFMKNSKVQVLGWTKEKFEEELRNNAIFCKKADSIEELAKKLGICEKGLKETVEKYNDYVDDGKDLEFNRKTMKGEIKKGPFYGFACMPVAMANLGGLKAGSTMEILDVYDKPIKHLYAAGETLGGLHGDTYLTGDSVGGGMTIGRYLGKLVAKNK